MNKKIQVLIVEDEPVSRKVLQRMLYEYCECHIAVNGREAIELFRRSVEENKPYDLICMDILMPEVDGLQALETIRNLENEMHVIDEDRVKVIMTTTVTDPESLSTALIRLNVSSYLIKPINRHRLLFELYKLGLIKRTSEKEPVHTK